MQMLLKDTEAFPLAQICRLRQSGNGNFLDTGAGNEYNTMDTMEAQCLLWKFPEEKRCGQALH